MVEYQCITTAPFDYKRRL